MAALIAALCRLAAIMPHGSTGSKAQRYAAMRRRARPSCIFREMKWRAD